ncbi:hypothetical protein EFE32_07845 [Lactococcus lactis subsp. lactis]|uniref:EF0163 family protein n=1 Tax=Lactococcus lactis TaxID=1358 RepID=UPI00223A8D3A|nr:EF0163 family protein [Lactococcus lactis]MCT0016752.1 hypothetical protein [Lactococcus lactis subsp. lactis]
MKIKTILCVGLVATSVALLSACQMKVEKTSSNNKSNTPRYSYNVQEGSKESSEDNKKSSSKKEESSSSSKVSSTTSDTENKLKVAQKFIDLYCNYSSIDGRNKAIKPLLTAKMQKELAVNVSVPAKVESKSESIDIYQSEKSGKILGLVKQKVATTSSIQVYVLEVTKTGKEFQVSSFECPTMP